MTERRNEPPEPVPEPDEEPSHQGPPERPEPRDDNACLECGRPFDAHVVTQDHYGGDLYRCPPVDDEDLDTVTQVLERAGFQVVSIHRGPWSIPSTVPERNRPYVVPARPWLN